MNLKKIKDSRKDKEPVTDVSYGTALQAVKNAMLCPSYTDHFIDENDNLVVNFDFDEGDAHSDSTMFINSLGNHSAQEDQTEYGIIVTVKDSQKLADAVDDVKPIEYWKTIGRPKWKGTKGEISESVWEAAKKRATKDYTAPAKWSAVASVAKIYSAREGNPITKQKAVADSYKEDLAEYKDKYADTEDCLSTEQLDWLSSKNVTVVFDKTKTPWLPQAWYRSALLKFNSGLQSASISFIDEDSAEPLMKFCDLFGITYKLQYQITDDSDTVLEYGGEDINLGKAWDSLLTNGWWANGTISVEIEDIDDSQELVVYSQLNGHEHRAKWDDDVDDIDDLQGILTHAIRLFQ